MAEQQVPSGYKQTEVGVIPEGWEIKRACEIFIKIQDGTHFSPKVGGNEYLYVTSKNIRTGRLDLSTAEYIDERQHKGIYKRCDVKKGDILLTKDGANTGNAALNSLDEEFSLLSSVAFLRVDGGKGSSEFYLQQIISKKFQQSIQVAMSGNAITRLTLDKINKLVFFVPSKKEQTAIANALSDVDALITSLEKLIAKKRALKTATMQQLLTGKKRLPPFDKLASKNGTPRYKQTELGEIPEDWEVDSVANILAITTGDKNTQDKIDDGQYPFFVRSQKIERINSYSFDGEAVLTAGDGVGTGKIYHYVAGKFDYHQRVYLMCNFSSRLDGYYFYIYFSNNFYDRIMSMTAKSSVDSVRREMITNMKIVLPSIDEQIAIASVLSDMDKEVDTLEKRLNKTQQIKQGMMQELLTGKTRLV